MRLHNYQALDLLAIQAAQRLHDREHSRVCSGLTGTWSEIFFANRADFTTLSSFTTEASLLAGGGNELPTIPALFFANKAGDRRAIKILARGVFSVTGTPTYLWTVRLGTTAGSTFLSGTQVGCTAAATAGSGVTNQLWQLELDLICTTPGSGSGNTTLSGAGMVFSGGLASPFMYPIEPTTPPTATWTATIDNSLTQYINISATCSASSSSNTITCKQLLVAGLN